MGAELAGDLELSLATMTNDPHLVNVPTMIGGAGRTGVRSFYTDRLIGKFFPLDVEFTEVSRTIGDGRLVDELVISFAHTQEIEWMLPGRGCFDSAGLPVAGADAAAKVLDPTIPGPHD